MKIKMVRSRITTLGSDPRISFADDRPNARGRGYSSKWDRAATDFKRDHPLCLGCSAVGVRSATEVVDHVEPHKGDWQKFWNRTMWQPACRWHHDTIKKRLETLYIAGVIGTADLWLNSPRAIGMTRSRGHGG